MPTCRLCGKSITSQYVVCKECYKSNYYKTRKGYSRSKDTREYVQRELAAKILGRPLKPREVVDHKNHDRSDNRPSNLRIFANQAAHAKWHNVEKTGQKKPSSGQVFKKKRKGLLERLLG